MHKARGLVASCPRERMNIIGFIRVPPNFMTSSSARRSSLQVGSEMGKKLAWWHHPFIGEHVLYAAVVWQWYVKEDNDPVIWRCDETYQGSVASTAPGVLKNVLCCVSDNRHPRVMPWEVVSRCIGLMLAVPRTSAERVYEKVAVVWHCDTQKICGGPCAQRVKRWYQRSREWD